MCVCCGEEGLRAYAQATQEPLEVGNKGTTVRNEERIRAEQV